ncbi:F-box/kelch-repeat protein SKIP25-like [Chenopodium quinoa]|uniref:F-box/kelch-repeat protein SKIP25-like n=1 Tax=Chenopodium quinoa TaxID=63459 RepID=UPI000B786FC7|nr:F-box/kelch-repeat protein SKIP25-like [Chenopodium quinoa]
MKKQLQQLIPGLPDHIAQLILSKIPPSLLYTISHSWRSFIYSPLYPPFYSLYTLLIPNITIKSSPSNPQQFLTPISFFAFDPICSKWEPLPVPPPLSLLLRHPPFISRDLPVQSVAVGNRLAVVAGTTEHLAPALSRPLVFDPISRDWRYGPSVPVPRRWCAAGALDTSLYMASGVGPHFSTDTARSVERWDLSRGCDKWEKVSSLRDGRFSREATDAIGWHGRLCMVNVKGDTAKQGAVYSAEQDLWGDMKEGMLSGWRGPAAAMDEEMIYVVDESKGVVRKYNEETDGWVDVVESDRLRGAQQMAARGGRLCVVCKGGSEIVVVDVVASPPQMWVVEPPQGFNVAAVHVLPRMSRT